MSIQYNFLTSLINGIEFDKYVKEWRVTQDTAHVETLYKTQLLYDLENLDLRILLLNVLKHNLLYFIEGYIYNYNEILNLLKTKFKNTKLANMIINLFNFFDALMTYRYCFEDMDYIASLIAGNVLPEKFYKLVEYLTDAKNIDCDWNFTDNTDQFVYLNLDGIKKLLEAYDRELTNDPIHDLLSLIVDEFKINDKIIQETQLLANLHDTIAKNIDKVFTKKEELIKTLSNLSDTTDIKKLDKILPDDNILTIVTQNSINKVTDLINQTLKNKINNKPPQTQITSVSTSESTTVSTTENVTETITEIDSNGNIINKEQDNFIILENKNNISTIPLKYFRIFAFYNNDIYKILILTRNYDYTIIEYDSNQVKNIIYGKYFDIRELITDNFTSLIIDSLGNITEDNYNLEIDFGYKNNNLVYLKINNVIIYMKNDEIIKIINDNNVLDNTSINKFEVYYFKDTIDNDVYIIQNNTGYIYFYIKDDILKVESGIGDFKDDYYITKTFTDKICYFDNVYIEENPNFYFSNDTFAFTINDKNILINKDLSYEINDEKYIEFINQDTNKIVLNDCTHLVVEDNYNIETPNIYYNYKLSINENKEILIKDNSNITPISKFKTNNFALDEIFIIFNEFGKISNIVKFDKNQNCYIGIFSDILNIISKIHDYKAFISSFSTYSFLRLFEYNNKIDSFAYNTSYYKLDNTICINKYGSAFINEKENNFSLYYNNNAFYIPFNEGYIKIENNIAYFSIDLPKNLQKIDFNIENTKNFVLALKLEKVPIIKNEQPVLDDTGGELTTVPQTLTPAQIISSIKTRQDITKLIKDINVDNKLSLIITEAVNILKDKLRSLLNNIDAKNVQSCNFQFVIDIDTIQIDKLNNFIKNEKPLQITDDVENIDPSTEYFLLTTPNGSIDDEMLDNLTIMKNADITTPEGYQTFKTATNKLLKKMDFGLNDTLIKTDSTKTNTLSYLDQLEQLAGKPIALTEESKDLLQNLLNNLNTTKNINIDLTNGITEINAMLLLMNTISDKTGINVEDILNQTNAILCKLKAIYCKLDNSINLFNNIMNNINNFINQASSTISNIINDPTGNINLNPQQLVDDTINAVNNITNTIFQTLDDMKDAIVGSSKQDLIDDMLDQFSDFLDNVEMPGDISDKLLNEIGNILSACPEVNNAADDIFNQIGENVSRFADNLINDAINSIKNIFANCDKANNSLTQISIPSVGLNINIQIPKINLGLSNVNINC